MMENGVEIYARITSSLHLRRLFFLLRCIAFRPSNNVSRRMHLHCKRRMYLTALFIVVVDAATCLAPITTQTSWKAIGMSTISEFRLQRMTLSASAPSFDGRFEKWRFLQDLLDGEIEDSVLGELLLNVLGDFLGNQPVKTGDDVVSGSPELTPDLVSKLHASIKVLKQDSEAAMTDFAEAGAISKLDDLLPDPTEDEDAHKSVWDTILEIHGQDMVRAKETNPTLEWRKLCLVARLLIHFDFLSKT